ncbi:single-stranded-DNA-specific exonuclease RecJ [Nitrosomonadales bacterium]|nr:single-stranded-DNA-specific exonuclease RecJ [Nitrosomonadales bacterium]
MLHKEKNVDLKIFNSLIKNDTNPVLSNLFAARDIKSIQDVDYSFDKLISPDLLKSGKDVANLLIDKINRKEKIVIIGDYDVDGATATACAYLGLKKFGANVDFIVPNRFKFGYGLTPEIVDLAYKKNPGLILTVDNGIASIKGVQKANTYGIDVVITDHHLPGDKLPNTKFIVNPNQLSCKFPSKNLCGAGVIFYVLILVRSQIRNKKNDDHNYKIAEPSLGDLIDLVALGTIADLVKLDFNNRVLVNFGIKKIRTGSCNFGIEAILNLCKKKFVDIKTSDLSYLIAPKINAAGRLSDMSIGIKCLISKNKNEAKMYAKKLNIINQQRKIIEDKMKQEAFSIVDNHLISNTYSISLFDNEWHQGVVGILASRLKEKYFRPTIIFAKDEAGNLKGSGRSIPNFHLRDALDLISKKNSSLIITFGGHAMAAGLSIKKEDFSLFCSEFELIAKKNLSSNDLKIIIENDKAIPKEYMNIETIKVINSQIWGQGFPAPVFFGIFYVIKQEIIANKHNKCILENDNGQYEAIFFNFSNELADRIEVIYTLEINEFNNKSSIQLNIMSQNELK